MLDLNTKGQADFEETVISNGYLPLISISTHHQPGCQKHVLITSYLISLLEIY